MLYNRIVSKKKKIIIGVSVGVSLAVIIAVIVLCLVLLRPSEGKNVSVILSGEQIFVQADEADEDYTYRFRFVSNGEERLYDSSSRTLDITEEFWQGNLRLGENYTISVCYVDSAGVLAGDFGQEIVSSFNLKLASPNASLTDGILAWDQVRGADYYTIYFSVGDELESMTTQELFFNLSALPGGERIVVVTSCSNDEHYIESEPSKQFTATVIHEIPAFDRAFLNPTTGVLTIESSEKVSAIRVMDNLGDSFLIEQLDYEYSNGSWLITANMQAIYQSGATYTVQPEADEFNIYTFSPTRVSI